MKQFTREILKRMGIPLHEELEPELEPVKKQRPKPQDKMVRKHEDK